MAAAHRLSARLASASLSPEQLLAFIDELAPLLSDAALRVAEEHTTRLVEQPEWVLSEVLLSPDLAPHILAQLPIENHAAKGTCRAWRRGWKETLVKRERPRLVLIGGHDSGGEFLYSLERYDASTNEWEEAEAVPLMSTLRSFSGAAVLDSKLYAVGGQNGNHFLSSVERYYPAVDAWEAVAPMATARSALGVAVLDGNLYAVGGTSNGVDDLSSVERYDPALDAWEAVAPMATARNWAGVAVLDGKLYAVGGCNGGGGGNDDLSSVERYDPALDAWEAVAPMATAREHLGVAVIDGKLYAVGGYNEDDGSLSSVERYDPALDAWEEVAPMAEGRVFHAVAVLDGKLYAVGGEDSESDSLSSVERYDPATNVWESVTAMAMARSQAGVALL